MIISLPAFSLDRINVADSVCFVMVVSQIPLYTILGTSISFALTFSLVDLANYAIGFFQPQNAKNLVESRQQIYVILASTMYDQHFIHAKSKQQSNYVSLDRVNNLTDCSGFSQHFDGQILFFNEG